MERLNRFAAILAEVTSIDTRFASFLAALLFALATTSLVIAALRWVQLMDIPNERSSHVKATVRGAGWGLLFGVLAGWFSSQVGGPTLWWMPVAAVLYGLVGFVDDLRSLPSSIRFGLQIVVASAAVGIAQQSSVVDLPLVVLPIAVFVIVAYVNAFNFMDGVNAISGLQAAVVGGIIAAAGVDVGSLEVQIGGLAIAGAALGFLPFNAIRARCFLGDVGSYFIGAWIAMLCIVVCDRGASPVFIGSVMAVYAADTGFTLVRRLRRGDQWWTPHREHVYQRLTDAGLSHVSSASLVALFPAVSGLLGLLANNEGWLTQLAVGVAVLIVCGGYLALPRIAHHRQSIASDFRPAVSE